MPASLPTNASRRSVLGALALAACATRSDAADDPYAWRPARIAPDATVAMQGRKGAPITLAAFAGRPVLLNIWATWCAPCVIELPALDRLQRDLGRRLSVIALSVDRKGMSAVSEAFRKLSIRHLDPYLDATGSAITTLKIVGLPATVAISASGEFLQVRRGRVDWDDPIERARLRAIFRA
jgi:thiol-disulfide isomerase/thioredoxin